MPMTTLFELTGDALRLQIQIDQCAADLFSDDPDAVAAATATLENLIAVEADNRQAVLQKADAWCWVIDRLRATAEARKARAADLAELAEAAAHQADAMQYRLIDALQRAIPDQTSYDLPQHKITSRKSTAVGLAAEVADLPEQFQRVKTTYSADRQAIAAALKQGQQIDGCSLVECRNWSIK